MKKPSASQIIKSLQIILIAGAVIAAILYLRTHELTAEAIAVALPRNSVSSALVIILLYAVKCILIFIPVDILRFASGILFSPFAAVAVNLIGTFAAFTTGYFIGRISGSEYAEKLCAKHPRLSAILSPRPEARFRLCFLLRGICFLPLDIVSIYLGAVKIPYPKYIAGSMLGVLPYLTAVTLMGSTLFDIESPAFWISAVMALASSAASCAVYFVLKKKTEQAVKEKEDG